MPGSIVERQLHESYYRMIPELLRYSSASRLLSLIPDEVQNVHRTDAAAKAAQASGPSGSQLWDGWEDAGGACEQEYASSDEDDVDLTDMGL